MRLRLALLLAACALACRVRPALAEPTPAGRWFTEDRTGVIEIAPCTGGLCGRIVGQSETVDKSGKPYTDVSGRPTCGLTILRGTASSGRWRGTITNPDDGTDWRCEFWVAEDGRLRLRGYVLTPLLGETQTWPPFAGRLAADCTILR